MKGPKTWSLVALLLVAALLSSRAFADRVNVRAWPHDGFVRVVFDWTAAVEYTARVEGRALIVEFDRPIETTFKSIEKNLADHVATAAVDESGHIVRIVAKQDFELRHFVLNGAVVTDLVAVASALPAVEPKPTVRLRVGEHADFTRVVFDWGERVSYSVEQGDALVSVRFERPANLDLSAVDGTDKNVVAAEVSDSDDGSIVRFSVPKGARIKHFRDGPRIALDVSANPPRASAVAEVAPAAPDAAPIEPVQIEAVPGSSVEQVRPDANGAPVRIVPPAESVAADEPRDVEPDVGAARPSAELDDRGPILPVHFTPKGEGGVLRFVGGRAHPAAVFSRGGWAWIVVDRRGKANVARLQVEAQGVLSEIQQVAHAEAAILRFRVASALNPAAVVDGEDWLVDFAVRPSHPLQALDTSVRTQPSRTQLFLQLDAGSAGRPIELMDPAIGDALLIVPVTLAGNGVAPRQTLIDFDLMETAQGIVLALRRESVGVSLAAGGLVVDGADNAVLHLTPDEERQARQGERADVLPRVYAFRSWAREQEPNFNAAKTALQNAVVAAPEDKRDEQRLVLARFYFVRGFQERALGVLNAIERSSPDSVNSPDFLALRGASRLVAGDIDGASQDLNSDVLDGEPEIALWRAAVSAELGDRLSAAIGLQQGHPFTSRYPRDLRIKFALLGARIGLEMEEPGAVKSWLESLDGLEIRAETAELVRVFDARAKLLEGDTDGGLSVLDEIIADGDRLSRAEAILARTELLLAEGDLSVEQAIEALESLRFAWRGDSFEFNVLRRLGELQLQNGAFQEGLQTLKRATSNFEEHPLVGEMTARMQEVFETLFLNGNADDIAPVKAIALFNEFRELTPPGAPGDEMIRHLADRLTAVDLLDQAAGLLLHQVEFRIVDPVEKAEVGARLAALRLLDRQPAGALDALDSTAAHQLPDELAGERDVIRARAMAELGEVDGAVALLAENASEQAKRIRAGILWDVQDWSRAAGALAELVQPADRLTERGARDVLRLTIALSLDGQLEALDQVRRDFGVAMLSTPFAVDFRIVSSNQGTTSDLQSAIQRVAIVDDFERFMEQYRGRATVGDISPDQLVN